MGAPAGTTALLLLLRLLWHVPPLQLVVFCHDGPLERAVVFFELVPRQSALRNIAQPPAARFVDNDLHAEQLLALAELCG
jgi:hypothetical protein